MFSSKELKKKALLNLKNNWGYPILVQLLLLGITGATSSILSGFLVVLLFIPSLLLLTIFEPGMVMLISKGTHYILSLAGGLFLIPLTLGYINYFLMLAKNHKPQIGNLFDGYKKSLGNSILAGFLMELYIFLWSLLLVIPGIIKSFSYAMTFYIIADNPKISAREALKRSEEMMKGHKWELFVLELSFIGWAILSLFTCGIGILFLNPYIETAKAHFYLNLKENYEEKVPESIILEEF